METTDKLIMDIIQSISGVLAVIFAIYIPEKIK